MMLSNEALINRWNSLIHYNNGYVRIDAEHPLEWHIGYEGINQRSLLLVTSNEPTNVESSKSILVSFAKRTDGKWALVFKLIREEQEEVYIRLCYDLIESSRNQLDTEQGIEYVLQRYSQWFKLLELQRSGLLSEPERKGLLGEMLFLKRIIEQGQTLLNSVASWVGPEGADQDFVDENGWHEIKAIGISAKTVSISSLEQLDVNNPGKLVLFLIDKTAPNGHNAFTLSSKVADLRLMLESSPAVLDLYNQKLLKYGYMDMPDYDKQWYRVGKSMSYIVDEHFPKLVKGNVQSQIAAASYQISIQAIEAWKIE
ncbi:PD-(D/E)XK motif protein [Paenibacillus odorifer]|uniref:PD-(D/E)XK motif protein n=2 Tax=Paenibacillus TaxID=44249 RepID=UPI0020160A72|nr:PD-(D/E)XK motif protein [Paenibacillus odorifer]